MNTVLLLIVLTLPQWPIRIPPPPPRPSPEFQATVERNRQNLKPEDLSGQESHKGFDIFWWIRR